MALSEIWTIGSTNKLTIVGLIDEVGTFINDATITAQMQKFDDHVQIGDPVTFDYVTGSSGNYEGILPASLALVENVSYALFVVAERAGKSAKFRIKRKAKYMDL